MVLYEDSTLAWYKDKGTQFPRGYLRINEAPELVAISEWTLRVGITTPSLVFTLINQKNHIKIIL